MTTARILHRVFALAVLLTLAAAACTPTALNEVTYTVEDGGYAGPDSLPAGWTKFTLTNASSGVDHVQLVKLNDGQSIEALAAAVAEHPESFPAWAKPLGGPNAPDPGGTATAIVNLEPGNYAIMSVIPDAEGVPGLARGFLKGVTVTSERSAAPEPQANLTIDLNDFNFVLTGTPTAGERTIRFNNNGTQPHEAYLVKLNEGVTAEDYLNAAPGTPPPALGLGGITGIAPGDHQFIMADLEPGNYALFCFFADPASEAPHFALGMVQEFSVP
jgi:hypothetical protein